MIRESLEVSYCSVLYILLLAIIVTKWIFCHSFLTINRKWKSCAEQTSKHKFVETVTRHLLVAAWHSLWIHSSIVLFPPEYHYLTCYVFHFLHQTLSEISILDENKVSNKKHIVNATDLSVHLLSEPSRPKVWLTTRRRAWLTCFTHYHSWQNVLFPH